MTYTLEDVAVGRKLLAEIGRHQWALGDLALKVAPYTGPGTGGMVLSRFATEIGVSSGHLGEYRRQAQAWPPAARVPGASYTLHRELAAQPDRIAVLRTYVRQCRDKAVKPSLRGLQAYRGQRPTLEMSKDRVEEQIRQGMDELPAQIRARLVQELLADQDTSACYATLVAMSLPPAKSHHGAPLAPSRALAQACERFAVAVHRAVSGPSALPAGERRPLEAARDRAAAAVATASAYIEAGGVGQLSDTELEGLLAS